MKSFLEKIAMFEKKNAGKILIFVFIVTIFMLYGVSNLKVQSDMEKSFPQNLPVYELKNKITSKFGGQDAILVLVELDSDSDSREISDIRDPKVVKFLMNLENELKKEKEFDSVQSIGTIFQQYGEPKSLLGAKKVLENIPSVDSFFSRDYSMTMLFISADLGSGPEKLKRIESDVNSYAISAGIPSGVKITVTGTPSMKNLMFNLLIRDGVKTLLISSVIIFFLIFFLQKSFNKSFVIFFPLLIGVIWTVGTMGWIGLELSMATAGIGTMILGLGVEYSVFLFTRYSEERKKNFDQEKSISKAVSEVGASIFGSSMTTILGFLALTVSIMPLMRSLGLSLAIGIAFCLFATIFISPAVLIFEENLMKKINFKKYEKLKKEVSQE